MKTQSNTTFMLRADYYRDAFRCIEAKPGDL